MYNFYLAGTLLPISPKSLAIKINNQNSKLSLINGSEINFLRQAGLSDIDFEILLPAVGYNFAKYPDGFRPPSYYLNILAKLKEDKKAFQFIVTRNTISNQFDTNIKVSLEDYTITESVDDGFDVVAKIKLKQYKDFATKTIAVPVPPRPVNPPAPSGGNGGRTYKVVKGDCLWSISQRFLGGGKNYPRLYAMNKAVIDARNKGTGLPRYTIYPNQVFRLE